MSASTQPNVLVIDDDAAFRFAMTKALGRLGFAVSEVDSGEGAVPILLGAHPPDVATLDLRMRGIDGLDVLRRAAATTTRVIVLTGHGTVQAAVEAMKLGAFSFLEKPVDADTLAPLLKQAFREHHAKGGAQHPGLDVPPIVGSSRAIDEVRQFVSRVGPTRETAAVTGETGTGKEVVARHLHLASPRAKGPFVALNAACVQRELFESELFGHKRGAFTSATADRVGLFGEADGGTLFIDEVGELPLDCQAKLLRTLETGTIRAVGGSREIAVDVRIVVATNRDLWRETQAGRFREDLYFRLQVFPIRIPPLRQRPEDIVPIAYHLLERIDRSTHRLTPEAERQLRAYHWPGNVRELLNVLRRAALFGDKELIDEELVRRMLAASVFGHDAPQPPQESSASAAPTNVTNNLADMERAHIERVLHEVSGNITRAATALGIDRRTLQRKLKTYGLSGED